MKKLTDKEILEKWEHTGLLTNEKISILLAHKFEEMSEYINMLSLTRDIDLRIERLIFPIIYRLGDREWDTKTLYNEVSTQIESGMIDDINCNPTIDIELEYVILFVEEWIEKYEKLIK